MKIHWIRAVIAAVLVEVVLVILTIPVIAVFSMAAFVPFVPPVCFAVGFPFGWWAARKSESGFVWEGTLVGIVATLIYLGLILSQAGSLKPAIDVYGPFLFVLANVAKILGCVAGAFVCGRRRVTVLAQA
ncbi:MAG TPA: hypothetical protein VFU28_24735 [Vicinamibacterales bacterium]|nr:hypothetical protein [Vicinamibacterales bacterium]